MVSTFRFMMLSMAINIEADAASLGIKQFIISGRYRTIQYRTGSTYSRNGLVQALAPPFILVLD
jgi:hypothetical protein